MKKATGYRQEHDSIGERAVPEQAYYGIQTLRAVENFCITRQRTHPALIESMVQVKKAAALANLAAGSWMKSGRRPSRLPVMKYWVGRCTTSSLLTQYRAERGRR